MRLSDAIEHAREDGCVFWRRSRPIDWYRVVWPHVVEYSHVEGAHWYSHDGWSTADEHADDWVCASGCPGLA